MKRRGFFGALLGLPALAKAMSEIKPVPIEVNEVVDAECAETLWPTLKEHYGKAYAEIYVTACSAGCDWE